MPAVRTRFPETQYLDLSAPINQDLVLYVPMTSDTIFGTTIKDLSKSGHTASLVASPVLSGGLNSQVLVFNGTTQNINVTTFQGILGTNPWSIFFRFASTSVIANQGNPIVAWGAAGTAGSGVNILMENGVITNRSYSGNIASFGSGLNNGAVHDVLITAPGGTYTTANEVGYIDGKVVSTSSSGSAALNLISSGNVLIGGSNFPWANGQFFAGSIGEVRIYARALTAIEAWELHLDNERSLGWVTPQFVPSLCNSSLFLPPWLSGLGSGGSFFSDKLGS